MPAMWILKSAKAPFTTVEFGMRVSPSITMSYSIPMSLMFNYPPLSDTALVTVLLVGFLYTLFLGSGLFSSI